MKFRLCPITPFLFLFTVCFAGGTALAAEEVVPPNCLPNCVVSLIDEAQVPAQEAGVIVELKVSAGMNVEKGDLLAQIDDAKPQMEYRVAAAKLAVAKEKSTDDINVRYAIASAKVAEAAYNTADDANRRVPGSVPKTEMQSLWLKHKESTLGIEKAQLEQRIAVQETRVAQAEMDAAAENIHRHKILSPLTGVVRELERHAGEWVQPGDPLVHLIRTDKLWVEGFMRSSAYDPAEIENRPVTVTIDLAHGRQATFPGKVVFVRPSEEAGGTFLVRGEVTRPEGSTTWSLRPGMSARMTIQVR